MPKKDLNRKKKEELERLIKEIKENAPDASKTEVEELEHILEEILTEEKKPLVNRIFNQIVLFMLHLGIMYIVSLIVFGFFINSIKVENKLLIFLFSFIISFILIAFERIPRDPFRRNFFKINFVKNPVPQPISNT